jgi:hypothetical protein
MNEYPPPVDYTPSSAGRQELIPRAYIIIGVIVTVVLAAVFILGIIWLARTQGTTMEALRDIMIIALALESCVFGVVLMFLLVMLIRLVNMLEFEIKPILEKTNDTLGTVRGTTTFMSENVVRPMTRVRGYFAGVRRGAQTLFGNPRRNWPD